MGSSLGCPAASQPGAFVALLTLAAFEDVGPVGMCRAGHWVAG